MAKTNDRVMDMVQRALARDPDTRSGELYEQAKKLDRSIGSLSLRQFHARYPLQVKRTMAGGRRGRKRAAKGAAQGPRRGPGRPPGSGRRGRPPGTGRRGRPPKQSAEPASAERAPASPPANDRDSVRKVLLDFAGYVARAENRSDMIGVLTGIDGWVDRVMKASR